MIRSHSIDRVVDTVGAVAGASSSPSVEGEYKGIDHFLKLLTQTAPGLSRETLATLRQDLEKQP